MRLLLALIRGLFVSQTRLLSENLLLRQQLLVYQRRHKRPYIKNKDRRFWILMARWYSNWQASLFMVQPETVLRWHRRGWRYYWRWKSRAKLGRPRIAMRLRSLIQQMKRQNPLWGQVRIQAELLGLGFVMSPRTVAKYMKASRRPGPPSRRWKEFLEQHAKDLWACDFLTVRTLTFKTLYVFFLIHHGTREIVLARVTLHPTAAWTRRQLVNACLDREPPRFLLRDNDAIYGQTFRETVKALGTHDLRTPIRAPKANAIAERFVGTLRRECLDHLFLFNERHLQQVVDEFVDYYNHHRPHRF